MAKGKVLLRGGAAVCALLMGASLTATYLASANASQVHNYLGTSPTRIVSADSNENTTYYASQFGSWEEQLENAKEVNKQVQEEGSVLLENNGALPLSSGSKVSLFSRSSVDIVYGGTGSGSGDNSSAPTLKEAMEDEGFKVNGTLWDFYKSKDSYTRTTSNEQGYQVSNDTSIAEVPLNEYTQAVKDSYSGYSDAAIFVFSRVGGEGYDANSEKKYLELQPEEAEVLAHIAENFETIIVLVNSSNAVSLSWLDDYGVDACLWIGGPGMEGIRAVAEILDGKRTPSGKLSDTYASSTLSSPAMMNFGEYIYANATLTTENMDDKVYTFTKSNGETLELPNAGAYVVEAEGIYVGYKYYETRYEDAVLGQGNASGSAGVYHSAGGKWNYSDEVDYAFGYGLSYTTFSQTLDSLAVDGDIVTLTATVTNTGTAYSGKEVVEVYAQSPYSAGGMEKASVALCGYAKTDTLAPGESQTLEVTADLADIATYDYSNNKTYVQDAGTYYFAIGNGAHDALNNILAKKGYTTADGMDYDGNAANAASIELEGKLYNVDKESGNEVTNLFDAADLNYYIEDAVTYLSRSDWQKTWPVTYDNIEATDEMIEALHNNYTAHDSGVKSITYGADNGITLVSLKDADYDDERWEKLLDQMTLEEQVTLVTNGASQTAATQSINFAGTVDNDGPSGLGRSYLENPGDDSTATGTKCLTYNTAVVIASTWSQDVAYARGVSMGEDGLWTNTQGWWGPGANTHRTPYSGRNFEYYSEDAFLGGTIGANDIAGAQSMGLRAFVKHYALNDQETNRHGLSTFGNEQAIREVYLKQFQHIVQEGKTLSLMEAFNRIGCTWTGGSYALCTQLLRDEWGFKGSVLTDFNFHSESSWMNTRSGLYGGTDQWLALGDSELLANARQDINLAYEVRTASHRILYAVSKTAAMNGMSESSYFEYVTAWWQKALYAMSAITSLLAVILFAITAYSEYGKKCKVEIEKRG